MNKARFIHHDDVLCGLGDYGRAAKKILLDPPFSRGEAGSLLSFSNLIGSGGHVKHRQLCHGCLTKSLR